MSATFHVSRPDPLRNLRKICDLAVVNCRQLLTMANPSRQPKRGEEMRDVGLIQGGVVAVSGATIEWVGTEEEFRRGHAAKRELDAGGGVVMPGFVDSHTHAVFAGSREGEWVRRIRGESYLKILREGGGILDTVRATRAASQESLARQARRYLVQMLWYGTTTVEVKSGYGLDLENEVKILSVINQLRGQVPVDIVPTFLGAHAVPEEYKEKPEAYLDRVVEMLDEVRPYSRFCDVFCEEGAFSLSQCETVFRAAREKGFGLKIHAGEFSDLGAVRMAASYGVISADHLDIISEEDMDLMGQRPVVGVLLPGVSFFLMRSSHAPARRLIDRGVPVALATDFNPGSCPTLNMQVILTLACLSLAMTPEETLNGATINGAHALGVAETVGSLEVGKQADILVLDVDDYRKIPYFFGVNHVKTVIKKGRLLERRRDMEE